MSKTEIAKALAGKALWVLLAAGAVLALAAAGCGDVTAAQDGPPAASGGAMAPGGASGTAGQAGAPPTTTGGSGGQAVAPGTGGGGPAGHVGATGGSPAAGGAQGGAGGGAPARSFPMCFQSTTNPVPWRACPGRPSKSGYPCAICDSLPFSGFECVLTDDPLNQAAGGNPVLCVQASCTECS